MVQPLFVDSVWGGGGTSASSEFGGQVREALASLYDPIALQAHPLTRGLLSGDWPLRGARTGMALRERLLAAIEALKPAPHVAPTAKVWRAYHLLQLRYVEARDPVEVQRRLGLSKSQYYREQEVALACLVAVLWEHARAGQGAASVGAAGLDVEGGSGRLVEADDGERAGRVHLLPGAVTRIGRDPANEIVIADSRVSRQHAAIRWASGQYLLHDLRSTNGTFVDGEQLTLPQVICSGAVITFAELAIPALTFIATDSTVPVSREACVSALHATQRPRMALAVGPGAYR